MNQDRQTNTARRARMAAGAEADAAAKEAFAKTMLNIADAMEKGEVKYLSNVKSRPDLEVFIDELRDTKNNHRRKNDLPYGKDFEATENIIRENVVFERPKPYGEWFRMAADDLKDLPGMKIAAKFLEKIGNENRERNLYLSDEQIDRILKIKANLGKKKIKVPYQLERILDSIKHFQKLKKAGINSDSNLADALIEYKNLSEGKRKADPIKEAERAIVGKKYDGMDFFPTPPKLAEKMVKELEIKPGMNVLEPSAGKGDLADAVRNSHPEANIEVIEPVGDLRNILKAKGHTIIDRDFEGFEAEADKSYDRIIMNPPFSKNRDVKHVKKAYDLLKPGGKLVAITGNHWTFANDKESQNFRDWLDKVEGESEELGQAFTGKDAFRQTGVNSQLVTIEKPARTEKPLYSVEYLVARYTAKGLKKAGSIVKRGFELIRSGVKNFAQWARQMFNQFGQPVKKHLRSLWKDLQVANKKLGKRGAIQLPSGKKPLRDSNVPASDTTGQSDMAEKIDKLVKKFNDPTVVSDVTINAEITLDEAKQKLIGLSGKRLINFDTGVEAKINSTQRNKLISLTALEKSQKNGFDAKQHNAAAASIDRLWKHAVLLENGPDKAGDANISSVKRFAAPVLFGDAQAAAYMTAKESIEHGHRVYSLELTEIKMLQHKGGTPFGDTTAGASSTKNDTLSGQKVKPMKNPRRGAIQLPSGKKPLRDSNVPASDRAFELLGIPKNRVVADYDFLLKRHPEYFKSQEEAKSVVEEVLKSPDFATEEKGQLKGLIKKVEGKRYFKNPKVKIDIVKKPDGYHVRSVHLLSDKQYTRDKEKSLTATVKRVAPENLANVFTTKSGLDSPVLTSDSSTKNNTHSGQKVKPMKNPRRGSISEVPIRKSTQEIIELPVELPDGLKTDSISAIRDWLKEKFQGKSVFNESLNAEIEFVGKGLKETVIQLAYRKNRKEKIETHKHSLPILDKLVEQAVYENSVDDKNKGIKKNFADKIHYLSTNVKFDGENYRVKLVVKQYGEKNNYHTHTLSDIEIKKESYAQKDGLRDYQKASAPFSDSSTKNDTLSGQKVKPLESSEKEAIAKFSRLIQSKNLQWKKINHKRAELELLIPGGSVETVATITKNPKGHWEWAGTNRHFLTIGTARKTIKSTIFESLKRSQQQASIRQRKQQQREKIKQLREERQKQRQFKKQQKADRFLSEQGRKEKSQQAIKEKKEPKDLNAKMESYKDKLIKFWADSKRPLQKLQREIEAMANKKLPDWQNAYERFANVKGRIENRQKAFEKKYLEPLKDYMAENGITYNDFNDFVYAMHAPERNAYIQSINP
jgi:phospholipid N-methyltransferase